MRFRHKRRDLYLGASIAFAGIAWYAPSASPARTPAFSLNTPLDHIAANQRGKAVLEPRLARLNGEPEVPFLSEDMSLSQIAMMSGGRLSQTKLNLVQADLAQLSSSAGNGQR